MDIALTCAGAVFDNSSWAVKLCFSCKVRTRICCMPLVTTPMEATATPSMLASRCRSLTAGKMNQSDIPTRFNPPTGEHTNITSATVQSLTCECSHTNHDNKYGTKDLVRKHASHECRFHKAHERNDEELRHLHTTHIATCD